MRRTWIILSLAVVVLLLLLIGGAAFLNLNQFRPQIQAELQKVLGRPVTLGELHLNLFPLALRADGLTIGESPAIASPRPFATAKEVFVGSLLLPLLHGQVELTGVVLDDPQIELIRTPGGAWNFSDLGSAKIPPPGASSPTNPSHSGNNAGLSLKQLKIVNGQLAITDRRTKAPRVVYDRIDVTIDDFAPGRAFNLDAALHSSGPGKELIAFHGTAGPIATGSSDAIPVNGALSLQEVSLAGLNTIRAGTIPTGADASISGSARIASGYGVTSCSGNLTLNNATVHGTKVGDSIDAQYNLSLKPASDQIDISSAAIKIGSTAVSIAGTLDSSVTPARCNARVRTSNASIPELSRLGGLFGVAFDANDQIKGSLSADLTATGPVTAPEIQGVLSSALLQAQDIALGNVHANSSMKNGVVTLSPLTAVLFGGQASGVITVDTKGAHPLCSVKATLAGVDTNALLSAVSSVKDTLYGSLGASGDLSFSLDSAAQLAGTLNGTLNFSVANGQLKHVNILNELSRVGRFLNASAAQSASETSLQKLSGTLTIDNGVATTNNLVAVMPEGSLAGNGSLNLVTEGIDMHVNAVLSSGISKSVGGSGIGGYLNTALANNQGELVLPVLVTGSMAKPVFTPDLQAMAKMKLSRLLPTSSDPGKLATGLLGSLLGGANNQPSKPGQKKQNPLNSILDSLTKH